MWTAQMVQSCSSSPSVQCWSQLVEYIHKNEQIIWITPIAGLRHSSLSSCLPEIPLVSLAAGTWTHKHQRFAFPLQLVVLRSLFIARTYKYIHSLLPQQLSPVGCPDLWSSPYLIFRSPGLSRSWLGFMVPIAANSHIYGLFNISLVLHTPRIHHSETKE